MAGTQQDNDDDRWSNHCCLCSDGGTLVCCDECDRAMCLGHFKPHNCPDLSQRFLCPLCLKKRRIDIEYSLQRFNKGGGLRPTRGTVVVVRLLGPMDPPPLLPLENIFSSWLAMETGESHDLKFTCFDLQVENTWLGSHLQLQTDPLIQLINQALPVRVLLVACTSEESATACFQLLYYMKASLSTSVRVLLIFVTSSLDAISPGLEIEKLKGLRPQIAEVLLLGGLLRRRIYLYPALSGFIKATVLEGMGVAQAVETCFNRTALEHSSVVLLTGTGCSVWFCDQNLAPFGKMAPKCPNCMSNANWQKRDRRKSFTEHRYRCRCNTNSWWKITKPPWAKLIDSGTGIFCSPLDAWLEDKSEGC